MNGFRVWCKNNKEWEKDNCVISQDGRLFQSIKAKLTELRLDTHVIELRSNREDADGICIHAGDIVESKHGLKYIVHYGTNEYSGVESFYLKSIDKDDDMTYILKNTVSFTIIGHIHGGWDE